MNTENLTVSILDHLNVYWDDIIKRKTAKYPEINIGDFIYAIIKHKDNSINFYKDLGISRDVFNKITQRNIIFHGLYRGEKTWYATLLRLIKYKYCFKCKQVKEISNFGVSTICKDCDNTLSKMYRDNNKEKCVEASKNHYRNNKSDYLARNAKRRADLLNATPKWANLSKIKLIYKLRPDGYHVDHIIPLQGKLVCGLHVENNLQYLLEKDNLTKSNN